MKKKDQKNTHTCTGRLDKEQQLSTSMQMHFHDGQHRLCTCITARMQVLVNPALYGISRKKMSMLQCKSVV